mgnify:CR=1 FL=1
MDKKQIDRHTEPERVSFTLLVDSEDLRTLKAMGKSMDRTRGSVIREAIKQWIDKQEATP